MLDITIIPDSNFGQPIGRVNCLIGFGKAIDSMGVERILVPGSNIYADDKITTDGISVVSVLYNNGKSVNFVSKNKQI